jgi:oligoendopeptidase F
MSKKHSRAKNSPKKSIKSLPAWNLKLLYKSPTDPQIERDVVAFENSYQEFAKRYDTPDAAYLSDEEALHEALTAYEQLLRQPLSNPLTYFNLLKDIDATNPAATSQLPLLSNRYTKAENQIKFFKIRLGAIPVERQKQFLASARLAHFRYLLSRVFAVAAHVLSTAEEKIMSQKSLPAHEMWVSHTERLLGTKSVVICGRRMSLAQALNTTLSLPTANARRKASQAVNAVLGEVAPFAEGEINAIITNKKINDELCGYRTPYEHTVMSYQNDPAVVDTLVKTVTDNFKISHRFYRLKARMLKQKKLRYSDRAASVGKLRASFSFETSYSHLKKYFGGIDGTYSRIFEEYVENGQVDVAPRLGKTSGAYCSSNYERPTFVLLNDVGDLRSFTTFAHEMGHAFHGELSKSQGPLYWHYSTALAETASTLFEGLAFESILDSLSDKEKIVALHNRISGDVSSIFRQIACFNFELSLHTAVRARGFVPQDEIMAIHNRNMQAYLGPACTLDAADGSMFVQWSHIRRFFYVYSYAYGLLVSKALIRRYRADPSFWPSIEKFLSAGGSASPEDILADIGIDVRSPEFFREGLRQIEEDIEKLEGMVRKTRVHSRQ